MIEEERSVGELTRKLIGQLVNRADAGGLLEDDVETVALIHKTSRRFIEEADDLDRARDYHERHIDLLKGCPLCELEAAHQRDRLSCDICGEPLKLDEPYDGHRDCELQR